MELSRIYSLSLYTRRNQKIDFFSSFLFFWADVCFWKVTQMLLTADTHLPSRHTNNINIINKLLRPEELYVLNTKNLRWFSGLNYVHRHGCSASIQAKQPLHQQIYNLKDNPEDWLDKQVFARKQSFSWRSRTTLTKKVQRNDHGQYLAYCPWSSTTQPFPTAIRHKSHLGAHIWRVPGRNPIFNKLRAVWHSVLFLKLFLTRHCWVSPTLVAHTFPKVRSSLEAHTLVSACHFQLF